jgi:hypothetical protein
MVPDIVKRALVAKVFAANAVLPETDRCILWMLP